MTYSAEETYRRMHRTNVLAAIFAVAPLSIVFIGVWADTWWEGVVIGIGSVMALVVVTQWGVKGVPRFSTPAFVVTSAVWAASAGFFANPIGFFPLLVVGAVSVPRLSRWRPPAAAAFSCFVASLGLPGLAHGPVNWLTVFLFVLLPGGLALFVTLGMFLSEKYWVHFRDLEQSRKAEAELGIMRERMRFASDLHDIQGHTLHVVKLKVALAQKLLHSDVDRAAAELQEVHALVGDTIAQTKELAHAQRTLNLSAELENAKNLFEAAGIAVRIVREGEARDGVNELLGQVLRETTTNILRHAQATRVRITLSGTGVEIVNDGAPDGPPPQLSGLSTLKERVASEGGRLTVGQGDGRFITAARFPSDAAEPAGVDSP